MAGRSIVRESSLRTGATISVASSREATRRADAPAGAGCPRPGSVLPGALGTARAGARATCSFYPELRPAVTSQLHTVPCMTCRIELCVTKAPPG